MRLVVSCVVLLSVFSLAAQAASKAKTTPTPVPTDTGAAVASPERPFTDGTVSFKLGKKDYNLSKVGGSIQTSGPYQIASVKFEGGGGFPKLQMDFMYTRPGDIDPAYITNFFAIDEEKTITAMKPHVTFCSVTLTAATPSSVDGTASCPKGMFNGDKPGKTISDVKFHAEAK